MPGLKGSVLITGANGGLGSAFVSNFIKSAYGSQYRGLYLVRDPTKATDLKNVLHSAPKSHTSETLPSKCCNCPELLHLVIEEANPSIHHRG